MGLRPQLLTGNPGSFQGELHSMSSLSSSPSHLRSITERPNCLTLDIDTANPLGILRILRQSDAQLFAGWSAMPGLGDAETKNQLAHLAQLAAGVLSRGGQILMTGAGTSGRLAAFASRTYDGLPLTSQAKELPTARRARVKYLMAGGAPALIQAQEGAEDDARRGREEVLEAAQDGKPLFLIGITCGMSAPYVAGQLEAILDGTVEGEAVLLGFNPPELARRIPVENWDKTFADVVDQLLLSPRGHLLNPIVGPEPVTGSTRMKGGSATKILLEVLVDTACRLAADLLPSEDASTFISEALEVYHKAIWAAYDDVPALAELVAAAGQTLRRGGRLTYLGTVGPETPALQNDPSCDFTHPVTTEGGLLGLVDASECPPTYGADFDTVRGYLPGGWESLLPGSGINLRNRGDLFCFDEKDFCERRLPSLQAGDMVVFLGALTDRGQRVFQAEERAITTGLITWDGAADCQPEFRAQFAPLALPRPQALPAQRVWPVHGPAQLTLKLMLNAVTTAGHILAGKVFGNRMVDLRISNNKLFFRTLGIIQDLMGVDETRAKNALLRSIYGIDPAPDGSLPEEIFQRPVSAYIDASSTVTKVVPRALLLATGRYTVAEATQALERNPIVRSILEEVRN